MPSLSATISPAGWDLDYPPGDPQIEWNASDASFVISPGSSLTFGFASPLGPGDASFTVLALNGSGVDIEVGTTQGPFSARSSPSPVG